MLYRQYRTIPEAKVLRFFQLMQILREGKHHIKSLSERLDTSPRSIYRYIWLLKELGVNVRGEKKTYYIEKDELCCPLCHKLNNSYE